MSPTLPLSTGDNFRRGTDENASDVPPKPTPTSDGTPLTVHIIPFVPCKHLAGSVPSSQPFSKPCVPDFIIEMHCQEQLNMTRPLPLESNTPFEVGDPCCSSLLITGAVLTILHSMQPHGCIPQNKAAPHQQPIPWGDLDARGANNLFVGYAPQESLSIAHRPTEDAYYEARQAPPNGTDGYPGVYVPAPSNYQSDLSSTGWEQPNRDIQSRRLACERVPPVDDHAARSEQQAMQTLIRCMERTQIYDLGYEVTPGLSTNEYLPMLPRGTNRLPPKTKDHGKNSQARTKEQSSPPTPARAKRNHRGISLPSNMPQIIRNNANKFGCPHVGCSKIYTHECDVKTHYWNHLRVPTVWFCTRCGKKFMRYDNALRHFRKVHGRKPQEEEIIRI
ncbi:hypothetical protein EVG20_g10328 [Dentipellis fragilis]|uniref:C2H2-type domain-containing protein n=1 Tax=Dentipellis fragilis TaxID=205917 RepID=A0A4Y9XT65_9AGAM|nr:hypothetical protein EVG20_g10328 [Dentipellis fragilis]